MTNLFNVTIGWLCEPFIRAWRAYVRRFRIMKKRKKGAKDENFM